MALLQIKALGLIGNNLTDVSFPYICEILFKIEEQITLWDAFDDKKRDRNTTSLEKHQLQRAVQDPRVSVSKSFCRCPKFYEYL